MEQEFLSLFSAGAVHSSNGIQAVLAGAVHSSGYSSNGIQAIIIKRAVSNLSSNGISPFKSSGRTSLKAVFLCDI
jgi:hypothetical protein